jgi:hypothetical protein
MSIVAYDAGVLDGQQAERVRLVKVLEGKLESMIIAKETTLTITDLCDLIDAVADYAVMSITVDSATTPEEAEDESFARLKEYVIEPTEFHLDEVEEMN